MPTTLDEAYDTVTEWLKTEWSANAVDYDGGGAAAPELRFAGVEVGEIPKVTFARFDMQPVTERQRTLRNGQDQRYRSDGTIVLQLLVARSDKRAAEYRRILATVGKLIFRGKELDGCIIFRNVRINWLNPEDKFLRANVVGEYEYDEIG